MPYALRPSISATPCSARHAQRQGNAIARVGSAMPAPAPQVRLEHPPPAQVLRVRLVHPSPAVTPRVPPLSAHAAPPTALQVPPPPAQAPRVPQVSAQAAPPRPRRALPAFSSP